MRVVQDVLEPLPLFVLEFGERQLASGPPVLDPGFGLFPALGIHAVIAREIGCLGGTYEAGVNSTSELLPNASTGWDIMASDLVCAVPSGYGVLSW